MDVGVVSSNGQDFSRYEENVVLRGFSKIGSLEGSLNFLSDLLDLLGKRDELCWRGFV